MKTAASPSLIALPIATAEGEFIARYSAAGLAELDFPNAKAFVAPKRSEGGQPPSSTLHPPSSSAQSDRPSSVPLSAVPLSGWHRLTVAALQNVLAGRAPKKLPPLDWFGTTEFQQSVWRAMLRLKPGQTRSYGEIARLIGRPRAVRAVGGACGANPIPVLVPCHRVLAAGRRLGGFGGGLDWKRRLLAREGVVPA